MGGRGFGRWCSSLYTDAMACSGRRRVQEVHYAMDKAADSGRSEARLGTGGRDVVLCTIVVCTM